MEITPLCEDRNRVSQYLFAKINPPKIVSRLSFVKRLLFREFNLTKRISPKDLTVDTNICIKELEN